MIKDLRLSGLCFRDQVLIENVQNILADLLKLGLDLLTVVADSSDMLVCTLGFLFLLDRRDDAPRGTSGSNDVFVCHRQKVSFVNCELTTDLQERLKRRAWMVVWNNTGFVGVYLRDFLYTLLVWALELGRGLLTFMYVTISDRS